MKTKPQAKKTAAKTATKPAAKKAAPKAPAKCPAKKGATCAGKTSPKKDCSCKKSDCKCDATQKKGSCASSKKECKCNKSESQGVCFEKLLNEVFSQLDSAELLKDYFFTELLKRGFEEPVANAMANRISVDVNIEGDISIIED